jgi:uncharacterized protein (UPF0371 family)
MLEAIWFDWHQYINQQKSAILERMSHFQNRLYVEVGGKFLYDGHASRVLPWFDPTTKAKIFASLFDQMDLIFCINYNDILHNRQLVKEDIDYTTYVQGMLADIEKAVGKKPFISCNMCPRGNFDSKVQWFLDTLTAVWYGSYKRYLISGYPHDMKNILSNEWYGHDEYIPVQSQLVIVTGAASNSGKLSTCLWQMYQETVKWLDSGYAKYETFPIRNLPLKHPINLAYEAATADIWDYNMMDSYHKAAYGIDAVNYNRDVEAFDIVMHLAEGYLPEANYTRSYKSPTDMGINKANDSIIDEKICCEAALEEIRRRGKEYQGMVDRNEGKKEWVEKCEELDAECLSYNALGAIQS